MVSPLPPKTTLEVSSLLVSPPAQPHALRSRGYGRRAWSLVLDRTLSESPPPLPRQLVEMQRETHPTS